MLEETEQYLEFLYERIEQHYEDLMGFSRFTEAMGEENYEHNMYLQFMYRDFICMYIRLYVKNGGTKDLSKYLEVYV